MATKCQPPIYLSFGNPYNRDMPLNLSSLLFEKFMEYQQAAGERKTLKEFAEYIGIGQVYLNRLMNERRSAGEKTIALLADFFQDYRFYDVVSLPRPDMKLHFIIRHWGKIPIEVQNKMTGEVEPYTSERAPKDEILPPPDSGTMGKNS